jgi:hypothetical protein
MQSPDVQDIPNDWQLCACGRTFAQPSASNNHKRTCPKTRKRLSSALNRAKERWSVNKRRKVDVAESSGSANQRFMPGLMRKPSPGKPQDSVCNPHIPTALIIDKSNSKSALRFGRRLRIRRRQFSPAIDGT